MKSSKAHKNLITEIKRPSIAVMRKALKAARTALINAHVLIISEPCLASYKATRNELEPAIAIIDNALSEKISFYLPATWLDGMEAFAANVEQYLDKPDATVPALSAETLKKMDEFKEEMRRRIIHKYGRKSKINRRRK